MVHDAPDAHDAHAIGLTSFDPVICQSARLLLRNMHGSYLTTF